MTAAAAAAAAAAAITRTDLSRVRMF